MNLRGEFTAFRVLVEPLPPLVRRQRRLEALLGDEKGSFVDQEKAVRQEIHELLKTAGIVERGDAVTCNGYQVTQRGQNGRSAIDGVTLISTLVALKFQFTASDGTVLEGQAAAEALIAACTVKGEPSAWAEVKPAKGAKVRAG